MTRGAPPASGHSRAVWSQDAEASVPPSGETASATTGAWCPSSTIAGCNSPARQIAMRASSPLVAIRPSGRNATALTAPSWKRSTCSAAFLCSDHRIADVSKLPESACVPSGEIASARTGPPWPRNCACAPSGEITARSMKTKRTRNISARLGNNSGVRGAHAERADAVAHARIAQRRQEGFDRGTMAAAFDQKKIIVLGRDREKPETVQPGHRFDRDPPIRTSLRHGSRDGVVRARLIAVAGRPNTREQPVNQHPRSGPGIAIDHEALPVGECGFERAGGGASGETGIVHPVHETLHTLPALHQCKPLTQQMRVVDPARGIDEVRRRKI